MDRSALTEIGVAGLVIAICAVLLWQSLSLPPGSFEPLGSAPVPQATAAIVVLCCLVVIARAVRRRRAGRPADAAPPATSPASAVVIAVGTLAYVALLHTRLVHFGLLTFAFLLAVIWALEKFRRGALLPAGVVAGVVGFGCHYVFTQFFIVDLPG